MTSPRINSPRQPSIHASPRTGLLPSPFSHSDETLPHPPRHQPSPARFTTSTSGNPVDPPLFPTDDDDGSCPEPGDSLLPPRDFQPFFTMITDAETGETYHPNVYYVFSDDEPDVLSNAALHALDSNTPAAIQDAGARALIEGTAREEERYVLLSMAEDGTTAVSARSLAPNWAVTDAQIRAAPTFDGDEGGSEGLMLMVEGLSSGNASSVTPQKTAKDRMMLAKDSFEESRRKSAGDMIKAMEDLAQGMIGGLRILDKVATLD